MPRLLLRAAPRAALASPLTVVAAAAMALLTCFLGTATVLHSAAAGSAALAYQAEQVCPDSYGPAFTQSGVPASAVPELVNTIERHAGKHGFDKPKLSMFAGSGISEFNGERYRTRFGYVEDGLDHLTLIRGNRQPGAWLGSQLADTARVPLGARGNGGALPPITGIYEDLVNPAPTWWCSQQDLAVQNKLVDQLNTGAVVFTTDRATFERYTVPYDSRLERLTLNFTDPPPRTLAEAEERQQRADALITAVDADLGSHGRSGMLHATTAFDRSVQIAQQAQENVLFSSLPLAALTVLIGCAAVGTVALQWYQRRYNQVRLLSARGASPAALGVLAAAELGTPIVLGGATGAASAKILAPAYGPPGVLSTGATVTGFLIALAVVLISLGLLATVVTVRARREFELGRVAGSKRVRWLLAWFPWELITSAVALAGWLQLREFGASGRSLNPLPSVHPLALSYPVFVILTAGLLTTRIAWLLLRLSHRVRLWSRPTLQLAIRRLANARATVLGVLMIGVLAIGTLAVGNGISTAQQHALDGKLGTFVGAESRVDVESPVGRKQKPLPAELQARSTVVGQLTGTGSVVLIIDPASFTSVAWLDEMRSDLDELMARLAERGGATIPAVRIGHTEGQRTTLPGIPPAKVIADLPFFPIIGSKPGYVISRDALTTTQLDSVPRWILLSTSPLTELSAVLDAADIVHPNPASRDTAFDALPFYVVEWTFSFILMLGGVLAAVAILALFVAVEVRRRQNALSGALFLRMGMTRRALFGSHLTEFGLVTGVAVIVGMVCGWTVAAISVPRFDPAPWLAPRPLLPDFVPFAPAVTGASVLVVLLAAWIAVRSIRTERTVELLRS